MTANASKSILREPASTPRERPPLVDSSDGLINQTDRMSPLPARAGSQGICDPKRDDRLPSLQSSRSCDLDEWQQPRNFQRHNSVAYPSKVIIVRRKRQERVHAVMTDEHCKVSYQLSAISY